LHPDRLCTNSFNKRRGSRAAVGITAAHLQKLLPRLVDPFYQVAALFGCEAN
jgi:hypothetical protein